MIAAIGGGAEDAPANSRANHKGWHWIAEETLSVIFPDQGLGGAGRLLADADNSPRNYANSAAIGIHKLCAGPRPRHELVAGFGLRTACCLSKSITVVDQNLAIDRFHGGGNGRTTEQKHRTQNKNGANYDDPPL